MATINGVEVAGDKSAHDFRLLDDSDKTEIDNGIEANREAAEDNHADIVRHRTDADVHVTPEWKNSLVKKETLGLYWTAAQTADIINEISIAGGAKLVKVDELPETGKEQTIYLVPKTDPLERDIFDEYVWIDGKYEFIGTTKADLSGYFPITGGALTGNIIERNTDSDHLGVSGSYWGHGAYLWLSGQNSGYAGAWYLSARDTEKSCDLIGSPAGVLSWGGKLVLTEDDLSNYATKTELNTKQDALSNQQIQNIADVANKANDANVVHKSGNETISGAKTFSEGLKSHSDMSDISFINPLNTRVSNLDINTETGLPNKGYTFNWNIQCINPILYSGIYTSLFTNGDMNAAFRVYRYNDSSKLADMIIGYINSDSENASYARFNCSRVYPSTTNTTDLGTSTNKWKSFNGINPGALSLPMVDYATLDTTNFVLDGITNNRIIIPYDGWLNIRMTSCENYEIRNTLNGITYKVANASDSVHLTIPVPKDTNMAIFAKCSSIELRAFKSMGNV